MKTILIGADICPIEGNRPYFERGNASSLLNDLAPEFEQADLCIANLECPLIDKPSPILKTGPVFGEPSACIRGIKAMGIDVIGLANNHVLDHGAAGLKNTVEVCAREGIKTVGAGAKLQEARRITVVDLQELRIGVLAVAEHEFSIAGKNSWGANPLDPVDIVRNINSSKASFDFLVVLLHGSDEFHVPTPRIKDTCHFLIELGANVVLVQHPHELGGYEEYQGGHIIYGQGALIMDEGLHRNRRSFHEGFLVKLRVSKGAGAEMKLVPFTQSAPVPGARRMTSEQEQLFRRALAERSEAIKDDGFVESEWLRFCRDNQHDYVSALLGHNRVVRKLNSSGLLERFFYIRKDLLRAKNIACCETHREAIETIFNQNWV